MNICLYHQVRRPLSFYCPLGLQVHTIAKSDNPINSLRNHEAREAKEEQSRRDTPEPGQVTLVVLARHPNVHAPKTCDDIHRQDNSSKNRELAQNVVGLLRALIHSNVDLREVILMRPGENPVISSQFSAHNYVF